MFKCKICGKKFKDLACLYNHLEAKHSDMIPQNMSVQQFYYYTKTGRMNGNCVMCKQPTTWNMNTNKYNRFCNNPKCKEEYVKIMKGRMIAKYGKAHLLNDPNKQREMLANRSISGTYKWSDGKHETTYTGSYELDFLKTLDNFFEWDPADISMPSPHTYTYEYEGERKFYIPDVFIHSLDLEIEIKDGGDNPNRHHKIQDVDKVKEKLKDDVLTSQKNFHYVKITNKNYSNFFDFLKEVKSEFEKYGDDKKIPRIFKTEDIRTKGEYIKESTEDSDVIEEGFARNVAEKIDNFNKKSFRESDLILSLKYDLVKGSPKELQDFLLQLIKGAKYEDDLVYVNDLVGKSETYYYNLLKKCPEIKNEYINYHNWTYTCMRKEMKDRLKKIKESVEEIDIVEEKFEPDKFLVWFDKPIKKLIGGKLRIFHGSSILINEEFINPVSFNVGATKHSDPRWSTYFWDNKEDAMKWASVWEVSNYHRETLYIGHNGKSMLGKPEGMETKDFINDLINKMSKAKFYIYECEVDIKDLEIGSCPSIKEYTVSKPVKILKKFEYTLNKEIMRRCFNILPVDEVIKFKEQNKGVKHLKLHRNFILNQVLDNTRDSYRAIMRTDLQQGNIKVGDDLSGYKDSINHHVKKDTYGLKESYITDIIEESSISMVQLNLYLQNQYEEEMKHYLDTYKKYYEIMQKEKPHAVKNLNEDIKRAIIFIDGLASKGVENNLVQFAREELGNIVNLPKRGNAVKIHESSNFVNIKLIYENSNARSLFGLSDTKSQVVINNEFVIKRDKLGNHCSVSLLEESMNNDNLIEFEISFKSSIEFNKVLKEIINEGVCINSMFNFRDNEYNFIKETCLKLFGVYPDNINKK